MAQAICTVAQIASWHSIYERDVSLQHVSASILSHVRVITPRLSAESSSHTSTHTWKKRWHMRRVSPSELCVSLSEDGLSRKCMIFIQHRKYIGNCLKWQTLIHVCLNPPEPAGTREVQKAWWLQPLNHFLAWGDLFSAFHYFVLTACTIFFFFINL